MNFSIVSKEVRVVESEGVVQVLIHDCDADKDRLFIASVSISEVEEYLEEAIGEVIRFHGDYVLACLDVMLDSYFVKGQTADYEIELTPYHEPKAYLTKVTKKVVEFTPTMIEEAHPYGFVPSEEYRKLIY